MTKRVRVAPPWVRGGKKHGIPRTVVRRTGTRSSIQSALALVQRFGCQVVESEHMTVEEIGEYNKGYGSETGEKVWFEPEPRMED